MILIIHTLSGVTLENFLYHKQANAYKKFHEICSEALGQNIPTLEEILTSTHKFEELYNAINTEHGKIEVRMFDIEPEDLSDAQNKVPLQVIEEPYRIPLFKHKGIYYSPKADEEPGIYIDYIDREIEPDNDLNRIDMVFHYRGWFFYKIKGDERFHCDYYNGWQTCGNIEDMYNFINTEIDGDNNNKS